MTPMTDKAEALADNLLRYDSLETFAVTQEIQKALEEAYNQALEDAASISQDTVWTTTIDSQNTYHRYKAAILALRKP